MQINEICRKTGLTKKAVEYYQSKNLLSPEVNENGYRIFSKEDLSKLTEITLLRKLDLNIDEIRQVLDSKDKKKTLTLIKDLKQLRAKDKLIRLDLIDQLINGVDIIEIQERINLLEHQHTIKERLLMVFPGYYGRYISLHFGQFLNEPIRTNEQKLLYDEVVNFLDNMEPVEIPPDLEEIIDGADKYLNYEKAEELNINMQRAYEDFDGYWENNKDIIIEYTEFKKTDEYQNSVMPKLLNLFKKFGEASGYYDVFIPLMRKLSAAYDAYYKKMLIANEKLLEKIPDIEDLYKPTE